MMSLAPERTSPAGRGCPNPIGIRALVGRVAATAHSAGGEPPAAKVVELLAVLSIAALLAHVPVVAKGLAFAAGTKETDVGDPSLRCTTAIAVIVLFLFFPALALAFAASVAITRLRGI